MLIHFSICIQNIQFDMKKIMLGQEIKRQRNAHCNDNHQQLTKHLHFSHFTLTVFYYIG